MIRTLVTALAVTTCALASAGPAFAQWPERPVTIVVPSGAGGGTDQTARMLSERLQKHFGQPFNVVNQGQGGGVVGLTSIKNAKPDGYTLGVIYNFAHYAPMGQADLNVSDFTPIAQYNFDPAGFQVRKDNPWQDISEALEAIKAAPEEYVVACGGGCGGSWPMAVATLMKQYGIDVSKVRFVSGQGAAAALQDLAAGGVDIVPSSLPEAAPLMQAGHIRSLVVMSSEKLAAFPDVPTLKEALDMDIELGAWRGMVAPQDLPAPIATELEEALQEIVNDESWRQQMTQRGFGIRWRDAQAFESFMNEEQQSVRETMESVGFVKQ